MDKATDSEIIDSDDLYAGCYAVASISIFAYNKGGNKGVTLRLYDVLKIKDGERFSGRPDPREAFADYL